MLVSEFTILLKTTPLASVVALTELTYAGQIVIARTYEATQVLLLVAAGYLFLAIGRQREGMYFSFLQAAVTFAALVGLTARFGVSGTAAALVVSQMLMLVVALVWLDGRHLARLAR